MSIQSPEERWWVRLGGISAIALALAYIIVIVFYVPAGPPPSGVEARLSYHAGNTAAWWGILGFSVLTDFLFIPVMFALYLVLKGADKNAMCVATTFVGLFVALDLALTWTSYASLITISKGYIAATNDIQKSVFMTAATYPVAVLESPLFRVYTIVVPAIGFLITSFVMLKGNFGKWVAYVGLAAAALSLVSALTLGMTIILASTLITLWIFMLGYRLYRLGQA